VLWLDDFDDTDEVHVLELDFFLTVFSEMYQVQQSAYLAVAQGMFRHALSNQRMLLNTT
jgi:hypothetical protein